MYLPKALLTTLVAVAFCIAQAQPGKNAKTDSVKTAPIVVTVVTSQNQSRKNEQVLFQSQKTSKVTIARTDAKGKAMLSLPAGDNYLVTLKALTDTSQYGTLQIQSLGPGEFFKDPLTVNITYDPAKTYTLNGLQYDLGKATIRPSSIKQLQELLEYLQWKNDEKIEIAGHTDNIGKDEDNLKLSQQRAEAVKAWLVGKGIASARIIAKGYGATQPVADNSTEAGRQQNRRTEVHIL